MPTITSPAELSLNRAVASFDGSQLRVSTGIVERLWQWTGFGFLTQSVTRLTTGRVWQSSDAIPHMADWQLPTCMKENPEAQLVDVAMTISDDEGFTSKHLLVTALMDYPSARLQARLCVRAYPDVPGLHVQLAFRTLSGFEWITGLDRRENSEKANEMVVLGRGYRRSDLLPMSFGNAHRRAWGYHNDLQNRNDTYTDMLKEHLTTRPLGTLETCDWANALCVEDDSEGIALLKESHRCVNQPGIDGGLFVCRPVCGVEVVGMGLFPTDLKESFTTAWATWTLVYGNTDRDRQIAFKTFDRTRYPLDEKYAVIQANTWGSSTGYLQHRDAAGQANVLREIDSCADLGIDLLQIDDGWQGNDYENWTPCKERYPEGWGPVTQKARELGVTLGLWCAGEKIDLPYLKETFDQAGFLWYKLDFMNCTNRKIMDALLEKVRAFELYSNRKARVNWDTTEVQPRLGYFLGREYGAIYYANRKPVSPTNVTYRPHTVLRDLWEMSHYLDLRQILGDVQDPDRTNPVFSNAHQHSADYCTAITLMSLPTFFMETQLLQEQARAQIRSLLAVYKQHRTAMLGGIVHPIGKRPDGGQFTGFQCHLAAEQTGYLTLFREIDCPDAMGYFDLAQLPSDATLQLTDLLTGDCSTVTLDAGHLPMVIDKAADFRFMRYVVKDC